MHSQDGTVRGSSLGPGQTEATGGDQPPLPSSPFKPGQHLGGDTPRVLIHLGTECRHRSWQLGGPTALLGLKGAEVLVAFTAVAVSTVIPQGRRLTSPSVLHRSERRGPRQPLSWASCRHGRGHQCTQGSRGSDQLSPGPRPSPCAGVSSMPTAFPNTRNAGKKLCPGNE